MRDRMATYEVTPSASRLWVFGSLWMIISTFGVLLVLKHLDHLPQQD